MSAREVEHTIVRIRTLRNVRVHANPPYVFGRKAQGLGRGPCFFRQSMRTIVYVDGFNLYYGSLKNTPFKWLDLPLLFETILQPHHDIRLVKYFTATISGTPQDQSAPQRQATYLRALQQFRPSVEVHLGHFLSHPVQLPLCATNCRSEKG